jgi:transposase-like protein
MALDRHLPKFNVVLKRCLNAYTNEVMEREVKICKGKAE